MTNSEILSQFVKTVSDNTLPFLTAMAAIGVLSMAIIQTIKDMFPVRNGFQRRYLAQWLSQKAKESSPIRGTSPNATKAETDLIRLATGGDAKAFYDLPIEQLCGQMNAATQVILDYPVDHPDLLRCLASQAETRDIELLIQEPAQSPDAPQTKTQGQIDARSRVIHQVQRAIDGFQISAGFRWKFYLQIASFGSSFLLTVIGLSLHSGIAAPINNVLLVMVTGAVGGFLAPVARDLVASLQKLRS